MILMVGSRSGTGVRYPVSELAARYGASVAEETSDWRQAYATVERFRRERPPHWARLPRRSARAQTGASTVAGGAPLSENGRVRMAPRLAACGLALAAVVLIAGGLVLDRIAAAQHVSGSGAWWLYPFLVAAVLAPAAVGALIAARRPRNPIGWILVLGALSLAAVLAAQPYAWARMDAHPGSLPGGSWAALVSSLWPVFFAWPLAVAFVFPDGRLPSRRWRPYALFAAGSMALLVLLAACWRRSSRARSRTWRIRSRSGCRTLSAF